MTPEILAALQNARKAAKPAALLSQIATPEARQTLWIEDGIEIGTLNLDNTLRDKIIVGLKNNICRSFEHKGCRLFLQVFNPPLRLFIVGAAHISQALAPMATCLGYAVTVVDPRGAWATPERFPTTQKTGETGLTLLRDWPDDALDIACLDTRSAVVALTHDPKIDDPALNRALKSSSFYIGALGSKKTHADRLERLAKAGFDATATARIHGPVGLDIGAQTPEEIAIAILAEMTAALRQQSRGAKVQ